MNIYAQFPPDLLAPGLDGRNDSRNLTRASLRGLFLATLLALSTVVALGETFLVTKIADTNDSICDSDCSLREAIAAGNAAPTNDIVQFDPQIFSVGQSIVLTGATLLIQNNGSLQIVGPGSNLLSVLGNPQTLSVIAAGTSAPVTITDLTVSNGNGGGISNFGDMTLTRVVVKNNKPDLGSGSSAGGIYTQGNLVLNYCTVTANTGIGVRREGGTTQINKSLISGNSGTGFGHQGTSTMSINDSTIVGNGGGGIGLSGGGGGSLTLNNSTVSGNYGATQGGRNFCF